MFLSVFVVSGIGFFLNVCYVFDYDKDAVAVMTGLAGTLWKVSSLVSIPVIVFLSKKFGKKIPYLLSMGVAGFAALSAWWFMTPAAPYLQLIMQGLLGPGFTCVLMLTDSMLADICDQDELRTGKRREAMLGAICGTVRRAAPLDRFCNFPARTDDGNHLSDASVHGSDSCLRHSAEYAADGMLSIDGKPGGNDQTGIGTSPPGPMSYL